MNQLDRHYQGLLLDIMHNGVKKETRNGKTRSIFGKQIRHKMKDGFPLLTTKKMYWKGIVTELLWFLRGDTNIKYLVDNDYNKEKLINCCIKRLAFEPRNKKNDFLTSTFEHYSRIVDLFLEHFDKAGDKITQEEIDSYFD